MKTTTKRYIANALKIWSSFIKSDNEKSTFGRVLQVASKFTWELPQTLFGVLYAHMAMIAGIQNISFHRGITIIKTRLQPGVEHGASGISSGCIVSVGIDASEAIIKHEYGHCIQSRIWGPFFIPCFGIPSLLRAIGFSIRNTYASKSYDYYDFYTESDADKKGDKYFDKPF